MVGGWWLVAGGWWLVAGGWWLVASIGVVRFNA
jgi:glutathione synthase